MQKTFLLLGIAVGTLLLAQGALACGEKNIQFVDTLEGGADYEMEKSACTKSWFPSDGENFLMERSMVKVTDHQAKHILDDYLKMEYGSDARVTMEGTQIPGHEKHNHGHGNPQLSHGHYTWTFNVLVPGMYDGKAFPMYVDMQTGEVYGVGCGFGAGSVVFSPDVGSYPDTDYSDVEYHSGRVNSPVSISKDKTSILDSISKFLMALFSLR